MQFLTTPDFWSMLASITTVLGLVILIWAAIVALGQLREATRARHLEAMLQVYEMIRSKEARNHRRFIYTRLKSDPEKLTSEEREHIEEVSVTFDCIGNLVESGLVPMEELFKSHCEMIIRSWQELEPYVIYHRRLVGGTQVNKKGLTDLATRQACLRDVLRLRL